MGIQLSDGPSSKSFTPLKDMGRFEMSLVWQLRAVWRIGSMLTICGALMLAAVLWKTVPHTRILLWASAVVVSQLFALGMRHGLIKISLVGKAGIRPRWELLTWAAINGLIVGSAGIVLFPLGSMPHQFVLALVLAGIGCAAVVTLSGLFPCSAIVIALSVGPLIGTFVHYGSQYGITMGAVLALFALGMIVASVQMHRGLARSIRLQFDKDELIGALSTERDKIEGLNRDLQTEALERSLVAESLKRSEDRYRAVVQSQTELVCRFLNDYTLTFANEACSRCFGEPADELLGRSFLEFVHPDDLDALRTFFESVDCETSVATVDHRARAPEGEDRWLRWTYQGMCHKATAVAEYQGVGRDITAQKRAEEALKVSEEKYRTLIENAGEGIVVLQGGKLQFLNPKMLEYTGLPEDELKTGDLARFFDSHDWQVLKGIYRQAIADEESSSAEVRFLKNAGDEIWFQIQAVGISWEGKPAVLGFIADVTRSKEAERVLRTSHEELEKRVRQRTAELEEINKKLQMEIADRARAEELLRESEHRFRTIFEKARDCIFVKDNGLRYIHVNPAMQAIFEAHESDVTGLTDEDLYGIEQATHLKNEDVRVLGGQVIEAEHTLRLKGRELTFNSIKVPMMNSAGEIIGLCGIARDVTERSRTRAEGQREELEFRSLSMEKAIHQIRLAATHDSLVLLLGESGSGKDFWAGEIHRLSRRSGGPFFSINCAAVAPELAESELFGHEAGSFTGAKTRKRGMLELAEGGTLLLNEIGELPPVLQAKLLTFLDTQSFTRVGGETGIKVSARLIAATNREVDKEVEAGRFRLDLYHRLNVFSIRIPPLRERREDIPLLVDTILRRLCSKLQYGEIPPIDARCMSLIGEYHWPGNVRELTNVLERALILSGGAKITPESIQILNMQTPFQGEDSWSHVVRFPQKPHNLNDVIKETKSALIREALSRSSGIKKDAANLLGLSVDSFKYQSKSMET